MLAAERIRQGGLDREADVLNVGSRERYQDFGAQETERASSLADLFNAPGAAPPPDLLPTSSSNITVSEEGKQRGLAKSFTDDQGVALGKLRAFGDLFGDISRSQARDATRVGQIGGFKRGSSNVIPLELDTAGRAGNGMALFGDILGGAGRVGLSAGLSGGSIFGPTPLPGSLALGRGGIGHR